MQTTKLQSRCRHPAGTLGEVSGVVLPLGLPKTFRNQQGHALALEFPVAVAEQLFRLSIAADNFSFRVDDEQSVRHRTQQAIQFLVRFPSSVHGTECGHGAREHKYSGQSASCETDQCDVICLCRELRLLLSQSRTLLLLHRTQSTPNLFHQLAALVCQTTLSKTSKQIAIAQFHHVLHHLQMLSDHGLDLCERLQ